MAERREELRAADSDRQFVAERLQAALNEGRLTLSEYDERLEQTYAARTYGDLDRLLDDLRAGRLDAEIPPHGTLARIRQKVTADQWAGLGIAAQAKVDAR